MVQIYEKSQAFTTFKTPFGTYCVTHLPLGLSLSQGIFQKGIVRIIGQLDGTAGIADDITVCAETEEEDDQNLLYLMAKANEEGLVFNSSKCIIKVNQIEFFGSIYTDQGVKPQQSKHEDICQMPVPQDKQDLHRFLGLMNFLAPYIQHFSDKSSLLHDL